MPQFEINSNIKRQKPKTDSDLVYYSCGSESYVKFKIFEYSNFDIVSDSEFEFRALGFRAVSY